MPVRQRSWTLAAFLIFVMVIPHTIGNSEDVHQARNSSGSFPIPPSALDEYTVVSTDVVPSTDIVEATLRLMEEGDSKILFSDTYRNVILVLGMTGAGKTTMTQLISGDNTQLMSYDAGGGSFLIKDTQNRISVKNIVSKSIFPELVIDNATNSALYDCPGFGDTRNASVEIANTYFIKKVIQHSHTLKILLVVNHNSVRSGRDRSTFLALMGHMLQLLEKTEDFRHSIAMIVTKVELLRRQTEQSVLKGVEIFLEQFRQELPEITVNSERKSDVEVLLDALLQKDGNGRLVNVQLFLQPEEPGPLSDIEDVQANRIKLRQLIFHNNHFLYHPVKSTDFGFTLSSDAKMVIHTLLKSLKKLLDLSLHNLATQLLELYTAKIKATDSAQLQETRDADFTHIFKTLKSFDPGHDFEPHEIVSSYQNLTGTLQIDASDKLFDGLIRYSNYTIFLEDMTQTRVEDSLVNDFPGQLYKVLKDFADGLAKNNTQFIIDSLPQQLNVLYEKNLSTISTYEEIKQRIQSNRKEIADFVALEESDLDVMLRQYNDLTDKLGIPEATKSTYTIQQYINFFVLTQNNGSGDGNEVSKLGSKFRSAIQKFQENVDSHTKLFYVLDILLDQLKSSSMPPELSERIKQINTNDNRIHPEDMRSLKLFSVTRNLDELLSPGETMKTNVLLSVFAVAATNYKCAYDAENKAVVVSGHFLTMSQVVNCVSVNSDKQLLHVVIMATKLFTMDTDFEGIRDLPPPNMYIFVPKLSIQGTRKISLDGKRGKDFESPALVGKNGATGHPGSNGGQFLGVFPEMDLRGTLIISARGGRGGPGQKGGSGHGDTFGSNNGAAVMRNEISRHDNGWDIRSPHGHRKLGCCSQAETSYCSCTVFEVYGEPGKPGVPGGDGGEGGQGGNSGSIHFAFGNKSPQLKSLRGHGEVGPEGPGGDGGPGGRRGPGIKVHRQRDYTNPGIGAAYGTSAGALGFGLGFLLVPFLGPFGPVVGAAIGSGVGAGAGAGIGAAIKTQGALDFYEYINSIETGPAGRTGLAGRRNSPIKFPEQPTDNIRFIQKTYVNYDKYLKSYESNLFLRTSVTDFLVKIRPWISSLISGRL